MFYSSPAKQIYKPLALTQTFQCDLTLTFKEWFDILENTLVFLSARELDDKTYHFHICLLYVVIIEQQWADFRHGKAKPSYLLWFNSFFITTMYVTIKF